MFEVFLRNAMKKYQSNHDKKVQKYISNIHITVGYKGPILANHVIGLKVNSVFNTNNKGNSWWLYNTLMSKINDLSKTK